MIVSGATIKPSQVVRDLAVVVDSDLSLAVHVTSVRYFNLIRRSLTVDTAHAFWSVRSYTAGWITATPCLLALLCCQSADAVAVCSESSRPSRARAAWPCISLNKHTQLVTLAELSTASHIQVVLAYLLQVFARLGA